MLGRSVRYPALMLAGAVAAALIVYDATPQPIQATAAALLVLVLLGTALSCALVPSPRLELVERVAFSLGLGLATLIVDGFIINSSGEGMSRSNWAISLGVITIVAAGIGGYRDLAGRRHVDVDVPPGQPSPPRRRLRWIAPAAAIVAAVAIVTAAGVVATVGLQQQPRPGFTELWLLPTTSTSEVTVGVTNREGADQTYRLEVTADDTSLGTWDSISLARGETWTLLVPIPQDGRTTTSVRATLTRASDPATVYREASIQVGLTAAPSGAAVAR